MPPIEIERKFLIKFPNTAVLQTKYPCITKEITQIYLKSPAGITRRVRKVTSDGKTEYIFTQKQRISPLSCYEDENNITPSEFEALLNDSDDKKAPITKTRYAISYKEHILEIDVYDFWTDVAILEVELKSEDEMFDIPDDILIIKEVTEDIRFKNTNLAASHNFDPCS